MSGPGANAAGALLAAAFAFAPALSGCRAAARSEEVRLPELSRGYRVLSRSDHDRARPATVLFALHAFQTDPSILAMRWGLDELAVLRRGWVLVVPRGKTNSHGQLYWNASAACCDVDRARPDDVAYLRAVLADVSRRFAVDRARVYAMGVSNGGFMAHAWACAPDSELAAIVSVAGAGPGEDDPPCKPARPVAVLQVHGETDNVVRYEGGRMGEHAHPSARDSVLRWLAPNRCDPNAAPVQGLDQALFQFPSRDETWACPGGTVALWTLPGLGHRFRPGIGFVDKMLRFLEKGAGSAGAP